jgi:hypothetical protein
MLSSLVDSESSSDRAIDLSGNLMTKNVTRCEGSNNSSLAFRISAYRLYMDC